MGGDIPSRTLLVVLHSPRTYMFNLTGAKCSYFLRPNQVALFAETNRNNKHKYLFLNKKSQELSEKNLLCSDHFISGIFYQPIYMSGEGSHHVFLVYSTRLPELLREEWAG